jgi:hypothetical protein
MNINGVEVSGPVGGPYEANDHGTIRPANERERSLMMSFEAGMSPRAQKP